MVQQPLESLQVAMRKVGLRLPQPKNTSSRLISAINHRVLLKRSHIHTSLVNPREAVQDLASNSHPRSPPLAQASEERDSLATRAQASQVATQAQDLQAAATSTVLERATACYKTSALRDQVKAHPSHRFHRSRRQPCHLLLLSLSLSSRTTTEHRRSPSKNQ